MKIAKPAWVLLTLLGAPWTGLTLAQSDPTLRHAELPHFDVVDSDKDGFLSIEEARAAFNGLMIVDADNDGYVSKGEAENAIPGLRYTNDTHEDDERRVGPSEYALMAEQFVRGDIDEQNDQ